MSHRQRLLFGGLLLIAGCRKPPPPIEAPEPLRAVTAPADQVRPGELAEGAARAFGLNLPRKLIIERKFDDSVMATGPVTAEALLPYLKARMAVDKIEYLPGRMVIPRAHVNGTPLEHAVRIEIQPHAEGSRVEIRDTSVRSPEQGLDEAERWRRAGFGPDGRQLGKLNLQ